MRAYICILFFLLFLPLFSFSKDRPADRGEALFRSNCSPCHGIGKEKLGPSLACVTNKRSRHWLLKFITNSQKVIVSGDPYATHLFEQYNHTVMPAFHQLKEQDVYAILKYIEQQSAFPLSESDNPAMKHEKVASVYRPHKGQALFQNHCNRCHAIDHDGYGPALASTPKRLPLNWLVKFVHNSKSVIDSGDPYAVYIYDRYQQKRMPDFEYLDSASIVAIMDYIEYESASPSFIAGVNGRGVTLSSAPVKQDVREFVEMGTSKKSINTFYKFFMGIVFLGSAIVHVLVVIKFYRYLSSD